MNENGDGINPVAVFLTLCGIMYSETSYNDYDTGVEGNPAPSCHPFEDTPASEPGMSFFLCANMFAQLEQTSLRRYTLAKKEFRKDVKY